MEISPKVALVLNVIATTLTSVLALGVGVLADAGLPHPTSVFSVGLLLQAFLNGILHAYSSSDAGPLVKKS